MTEDNTTAQRGQGPALVVTTRYLRRGPRRVALRTRAVALPGTYQLSHVLAAGVGGLLGLVLTLPLTMALGIWEITLVGMALGGVAGVFAVSWSPLKGESLAKWAMLWSAKRIGLVRIGGRYVRCYVGTASVQRPLFANAQMARSYVVASSAGAVPDVLPPAAALPPASVAPAPAGLPPGQPPPPPAGFRVPQQQAQPDAVTVMGRLVALAPAAGPEPVATRS